MVRKRIYLGLGAFFLLSLIGIFAFWGYHCKEVDEFNRQVYQTKAIVTEFSAVHEDKVNIKEDDVTLVLYFRGGSSDTWNKDYEVSTNQRVDITGSIYEMSVHNRSDYEVSNWYVRQNIHQNCFINNAWCGEVEIHQFGQDKVERVDRVNLQKCAVEELDVLYEIQGSDLMIPLTEGDYVLYYPSEEVMETPILVMDNEHRGKVTVGVIYYFWNYGMTLSDTELYYQYHMSVNQGRTYYVFRFLCFAWLFTFFLSLSVCVINQLSTRKLREKEAFLNDALTTFTHFVDAKDPYTKGHSNRVADYSEKIARAMGMSDWECRNVYYIALLHDVGKCYIDDSILKKPGRLTDEEFEQIKGHTTKGAAMLADFRSLPDISDGAMYHHERYDGKGYPSGKRGEEIPLIGRLICVADSFDAMNSDRCYRKKLDRETICEELRGNMGSQFDPKITELFLQLIEDGEIEI